MNDKRWPLQALCGLILVGCLLCAAGLPKLAQAQVGSCPTYPVPVSFAVIGDFGTGDEAAAAVAGQVRAWQPQFIISLGDNSYPNGGSLAAYQHNVQALYSDWLPQSAALVPRQRFWAVPGNHDWDGSWQLQPYRQFFNNPNGGFYYQMRLGAVAFFFLDSDGREAAGVGKSSRQAQWMQSALTRSDATWQVVVLHHPPYTSGARGNNAYMQWDFSAWGADLVLAGHEHVYERLNVAGLPYIVNGLGGGYFGQFAEQPLAESVVRWAGEHGALQGSIDTTGLHLAFYTVAGKLIDAFDLPCAP